MQFSTFMTLVASAAVAVANTVTFVSLDGIDRTVYFTPNAGLQWLEAVRVPGKATVKTSIPQGWIGNWYSVSDGKPNVPGMLGEVTFQGWQGLTYFDVSAIVNPHDHEGVKEMWPATAYHPVSGCKLFPCANAYYLWDDVQTKTSPETDLVCTLGNDNGARSLDPAEESESVKRDFVLGGF
jgi:hypothetical protein